MLLQGAQATPNSQGLLLALEHPAYSEQLQQGVQRGQEETQPASQGCMYTVTQDQRVSGGDIFSVLL